MGLTNPGVIRISGSNSTFSGTVRITGGANITVGTDASGISIVGAAGGGGLQSAGFSTQGNTAGNTGFASQSFQLVGGNNVTLSGGTAAGNVTITVSGANQTVQTQGILSAGVSTGGNTAGNTTVNTGSRLVIVGAGEITASQATAAGASTITLSAPAQSVQTQNLHNVTLSGNTAGVMAHISSGTMTLAGGNNITLSQNGNAVTISGGGGGAGFSGGVSNLGNSAGATGVTGTRLVFVGTNNVTLSQTTDANGGTISISGAGGGAGQFSGGISNIGNTLGSSGITGTQLVLAGANHITLSQSTGANGGTVTILPGPNISFWQNARPHHNVSTQSSAHLTATVNGTWFLAPIENGVFPGNMTLSTVNINMSGSGAATTSTVAFTLSLSLGLWTRNASTLSLLNSATTSFTGAATSNMSNSFHGQRWMSIHSSQWSSQPVLTAGGEYYLGYAFRSSGEAKLMSLQMVKYFGFGAAVRSGSMGVTATTGSSTMLPIMGFGMYTASSTAPPVSITKGQLAIQTGGSGHQFPHIVFDNLGLIN